VVVVVIIAVLLLLPGWLLLLLLFFWFFFFEEDMTGVWSGVGGRGRGERYLDGDTPPPMVVAPATITTSGPASHSKNSLLGV
jgi:hypothetical protein